MSFKVITDNLICATEKVKIQLNLEIAKLENLSPANCLSKGQQCSFYRLFPLSINLNKTKINGDIWFHGRHMDNSYLIPDSITFGVTWYNTKSFVMNVDLQLGSMRSLKGTNTFSSFSNDTTKLDKCSTSIGLPEQFPYSSCEQQFYIPKFDVSMGSKPNFLISGEISFTFVLNKAVEIKNESIKITSLFCEDALSSLQQEKNFTIICQGEIFQFNKILLCLMSEVFGRMIQGSNSKEAVENSVEIEDFSPDTIRAFQNIVLETVPSKNDELTPELLLFAQKYLMKPLVMKSKEHLIKTLSIKNIFEVIKVAYLIDDEDIFKTASGFFSKNKKEFQDDKELDAFQKSNPMCMIKVFNYMYGLKK